MIVMWVVLRQLRRCDNCKKGMGGVKVIGESLRVVSEM